jgi:small subunit ribosomal protein S17e
MGQVKTLYVKHLAKALVEKYPGRFTDEFDKNKEELDKLVTLESKRMRNEVAGYIIDVIKKMNKPKGMEVSFAPKEERTRGPRRRTRR